MFRSNGVFRIGALSLPLVVCVALRAEGGQNQQIPATPPKIVERPMEGVATPKQSNVIVFKLGDTTYKLYPKDPLNPMRDPHFAVQAPVHITKVDYDAKTRNLDVTLALASSKLIEGELKKELVKYFAHQGNVTLKPDQISFGAFVTRGYKLELKLPDGKRVTLKEELPEAKADVTINNTILPYTVKPEETTLHELLVRQKRAVDLVATMYVAGEQVLSAEARVTLLQGAWKRALEKVLPDSGVPKEKWSDIKYVTRDSLTKLEQAIHSEMVGTLTFSGIESSSLMESMMAFVKEQLLVAPKLTLEDLRRIPEQENYWSRMLGSKDIEASVKDGFTTKLQEMNSSVASIDTYSKLFHEQASKEKDVSKFRHWLKSELKIDGKLAALVKVFFGSADFHLDKKDEQLTESDWERMRESYSKLNTENAWKQYLSTNSSTYWEGHMNEYLTAAKVFSLHRVTDSQFTADSSAKIAIIRTLPIGLITQKTICSLNADPYEKQLEWAKFAELEATIRAMREEITANQTQQSILEATILAMREQLKSEMIQIDTLDFMVSDAVAEGATKASVKIRSKGEFPNYRLVPGFTNDNGKNNEIFASNWLPVVTTSETTRYTCPGTIKKILVIPKGEYHAIHLVPEVKAEIDQANGKSDQIRISGFHTGKRAEGGWHTVQFQMLIFYSPKAGPK